MASTGLHLARLFTDYEPGIHWPQTQMQSGTTGINTIRFYNPVKQGLDQDPNGCFVRRWCPELAAVPDRWLQTPWQMSALEQVEARCVVGHDYPAPIVDLAAAARHAREAVWAVRRDKGFATVAELSRLGTAAAVAACRRRSSDVPAGAGCRTDSMTWTFDTVRVRRQAEFPARWSGVRSLSSDTRCEDGAVRQLRELHLRR